MTLDQLFTPTQQRTLQAALDRIIPADDYPGAWEAGVGEYLSRQFERDLAPMISLYRYGLDGLNTEARMRYALPFAELTPVQQDALLTLVEKGEVEATWLVSASRFFSILNHHAAEGYYADPEQGGNHNALSWHMIGFIRPGEANA